MGMFFYLKFQKQYKQVKRIFLYTSYIFIMVPATPWEEESLQREGEGQTILYTCVFKQAIQNWTCVSCKR